jgi:hypothetical protein
LIFFKKTKRNGLNVKYEKKRIDKIQYDELEKRGEMCGGYGKPDEKMAVIKKKGYTRTII